ncbi:CDP-alcohol phosphatidyltransferase family protein [Halobellus litoreus]|uniref:CDP-alcohol phosphatidyltransferase family protein n=1 Tax=Halobellus litoreus TaxID=755310 RepID=A0ABD6DY52_9EURY
MTAVRTVPSTLRREWATVSVAVSVLLVGGAALLSYVVTGGIPLVDTGLSGTWTPGVGTRWFLPAATVAAFELWFCFRYLGANRPDGSGNRAAADATDRPVSVYESLGVPNLVTLSRGGLFAALAGFGALAPRAEIAWLPALLYGGGCALDFVDGFLARRTGRRTVLGAKLDLAFDTTGFLVAPVVAVLWGQLPVWYLSLSAARYLFKLGRGVRRRRGRSVSDLPDSVVRRPLAGLQMVFITLALTPLLSPATARPLAAVVLAPSLAVFVRDYAVVAGWRSGRTSD